MKHIGQTLLVFAIGLSLSLQTLTSYAHGVVESPASREQFCGVESKPDEIYSSKMTHEECRPVVTNADGTMDNSVYNFMAVLSHTIGRSTKPAAQLPRYVCGFDSEMWNGGKTPWDKATNWPTNLISSGPQQFKWNISWGNHFGDTEEFVYWITKPDFKFDPTKELTWNDFEDTPFCTLKYNDQTPNANPYIIPDKTTNRFITTCNVPVRKNRSVIYAEWGRTKSTLERFHSCIDVVFSATNPPVINALISPLPAQVKGATQLALDGSQSTGTNLTYSWSIDADNSAPYQLQNSTSAKATLIASNVNAQQVVTVNLTIQQGNTSSRVSSQFLHLPADVTASWKTVGRATTTTLLKAGDKVQLRLVDAAGKDYFIPTPGLLLTADTAKPENVSYALAQAVNPANQFSIKVGVLAADNKTITPIHSATDNMIYAPNTSTIASSFIQVEKTTDTPSNCKGQRKEGSNSYWLGYDVSSDVVPLLLDFSATGIDLTKVILDKGVFGDVRVLDKDKLLISTKPAWVNKTTPGFMAFYGPNYGSYEPFNSPINAGCRTGNIIKQ